MLHNTFVVFAVFATLSSSAMQIIFCCLLWIFIVTELVLSCEIKDLRI